MMKSNILSYKVQDYKTNYVHKIFYPHFNEKLGNFHAIKIHNEIHNFSFQFNFDEQVAAVKNIRCKGRSDAAMFRLVICQANINLNCHILRALVAVVFCCGPPRDARGAVCLRLWYATNENGATVT